MFQIFGDCVDTNLKLAGFYIGILSLLLWLIPAVPQIIENYKAKRCEALSFGFLFCWFVQFHFNTIAKLLISGGSAISAI